MKSGWKNGWYIGLTAYIALCLSLAPSSASAYVDPSTTTFLVQAVIGVGVAVAAGVAVYWRKAKKKVAAKLGIDENAKKEKEDDNIRMQ